MPMPSTRAPREKNDRERVDGQLTHYPVTYGFVAGTWLVYDPNTRRGGEGTFTPQFSRRPGELSDGLSNTIGVSEVKAYTPYLRDGGNPNGPNQAAPVDPGAIAGYGGSFKTDSGHTEWVDGRVHQTGVTMTFGPNTFVPYSSGGVDYDVDFNSSREGATTTNVTYAAVTSRSYHTGIVNSLLMDGSVRGVSSNIDLITWRLLGERADGKVIGEF